MIQSLLQLIAPDDCLECGQEGSLWCEWCRLEFEPIPSRCFRCHAMTSDFAVCEKCKKNTNLRHVFVATEYDGTAKALIKVLKYDCSRQAATPIAKTIAENLPYFTRDTLVVNVPTSHARVRERGFDHTAYIAKELAQQLDLSFSAVLARTSNSRQVGSSKKARLEQVCGAYRVKYVSKVNGKDILLIDDVVTTGATLQETTRILRAAGAKKVYTAVFAYSR